MSALPTTNSVGPWWQHRYGKLVQSSGGPIVMGFEHACIGRSKDLPKEVSRACHPRESGIGSSDQTSWDDYAWKEGPGGLVVRPLLSAEKSFVLAGRIRSDIEDPIRRRRYTLAHYIAVDACQAATLPLWDLSSVLSAQPLTALDPAMPEIMVDFRDENLNEGWLDELWPILEAVLCGQSVAVVDPTLQPDDFLRQAARCVACFPGAIRWRLPIAAGCFTVQAKDVAIGHGMRANTPVQFNGGKWLGAKESCTAEQLSRAKTYYDWLTQITRDLKTLSQLVETVDLQLNELARWDAVDSVPGQRLDWKATLPKLHERVTFHVAYQKLSLYLRKHSDELFPLIATIGLSDRPPVLKTILDSFENSPNGPRQGRLLSQISEKQWHDGWTKLVEENVLGERSRQLAMLLGYCPLNPAILRRIDWIIPREIYQCVFDVLEDRLVRAITLEEQGGASDPNLILGNLSDDWRMFVLASLGVQRQNVQVNPISVEFGRDRRATVVWIGGAMLFDERASNHGTDREMEPIEWNHCQDIAFWLLGQMRDKQKAHADALNSLLQLIPADGSRGTPDLSTARSEIVRKIADHVSMKLRNRDLHLEALLIGQTATPRALSSIIRERNRSEMLRDVAARLLNFLILPGCQIAVDVLLCCWSELGNEAPLHFTNTALYLHKEIGPFYGHVLLNLRRQEYIRHPGTEAGIAAAKRVLSTSLNTPQVLRRVLRFCCEDRINSENEPFLFHYKEMREQLLKSIRNWVQVTDPRHFRADFPELALLRDLDENKTLLIAPSLDENQLENIQCFWPPSDNVTLPNHIANRPQLYTFMALSNSDTELPSLSANMMAETLQAVVPLPDGSTTKFLQQLRRYPEHISSPWRMLFNPHKEWKLITWNTIYSCYTKDEDEIWKKLGNVTALHLFARGWPVPSCTDFFSDVNWLTFETLVQGRFTTKEVVKLANLASWRELPELAEACFHFIIHDNLGGGTGQSVKFFNREECKKSLVNATTFIKMNGRKWTPTIYRMIPTLSYRTPKPELEAIVSAYMTMKIDDDRGTKPTIDKIIQKFWPSQAAPHNGGWPNGPTGGTAAYPRTRL